MNPTTLSRLLDLNRQFYQTFALAFSSTRHRLQPGVIHLLDQINQAGSLLDLGCGNGELAHQLHRQGFKGLYTGLDFSPALLQQAAASQGENFDFRQADLSTPEWNASLQDKRYDLILTFAVLHHLPGMDLRLQVLRKVRSLLVPGKHFIHSVWQFLNSPRLSSRIQPWEALGISTNDVDPGDYLLDWRQGGNGLRYVHHFSENELADLASAAGFEVLETFLSDGENHRLGLYQLWK